MTLEPLLNKFKDFLLNSPLRDEIGKIILFGSYAKGAATPHSDIDLLVVTTNGKQTENDLLDLTYEFMVDHNLPLEVVTVSGNDLVNIQDYFLYNVLHYGVELYSMEPAVLKQRIIRNMLDLCCEYLDSASDVLTLNRIRVAADAAYNAAELAVKALILLKQDDLPGSHGGLVSTFGQLYVKTGEIESDVGRRLNRSLQLRNQARYKPDARLSQDDARAVIELARTLHDLVDDKILTDT